MHQCTKIESYFRDYFHQCEIFLFQIKEYGLYNISYSENRDDFLLSLIAENNPNVSLKKISFLVFKINDKIIFFN